MATGKSTASRPPRERAGKAPTAREARARAALGALEAALAAPDARLEPARRARLHYECGRLLEELGRAAEARAHYERATEPEVLHLPALAGLRRVLGRAGELEAVVDALAREASRTEDPARRAELEHQRGRLLERLGHHDEALAPLAHAASLAPADVRILDSCWLARSAAGPAEALDAAYAARLSVPDGDPRLRAALLVARAELLGTRLDRPADAREAYRAALEADPEVPGALPALDALLTQHQRWGDLAELLRREIDLASDPEEQGALTVRLARLLRDHLERPEEATALMHAAVALLPGALGPLLELYDLALEQDDLERLITALQGLAEATAAGPDRAELWHHAGRLRERAGDADGALACHAQALFARADHHGARRAIELSLAQRRDWPRLIHVLEASVAEADPATALGALARAAEISERHLGDAERALALHERILEATPDYEPSVQARLRLLQRLGRFTELAEAYATAAATAATSAARAAYLLRRAEIQELVLDDPEAALATHREVCEIDVRQPLGAHGLGRLALQQQDWESVAIALKHELRGRRGARAADVLHQLGELTERELGQPEAALEHYRRALEAAPEHPLAAASLEALLVELERPAELAAFYRAELERTEDPVRRGELTTRIGRAEAAQGDRLAAIATLTPVAREGFLTARRELERLLTRERRWAELARLLERHAEESEVDAERVRALARLGALQEQELGDPAAARAAYERALELDPACAEARAGLPRALLLTRDWPRLAEVLAEAAKTAEGLAATTARYRLATLRRDQLADPAGAIAAFEALAAEEPAPVGALLALVALYEREERLAELARVLAQLGRELGDDASRSSMMFRLTQTAERARFGSPGQLVQAYAKLAEEPTSRLGALLELDRLVPPGDAASRRLIAEGLAAASLDPTVAAAYLTERAELDEDEDPAAALDQFRAALERDPRCLGAIDGLARFAQRDHRAAELARSADLHAELGSPARAVELRLAAAEEYARDGDPKASGVALWRALAAAPDHPAARERLAALLRSDDMDDVLRAIDGVADTSASGEERRRQWLTVADALRDDVPRAASILERALESGAPSAAMRIDLAALYARMNQASRASELLAEVIREAPPGPERGRASLAQARLARGPLGDPARARELCEDVIAEATSDPDDVEAALTELVELRAESGAIDDAIAAASALASRARAPAQRVAALQSVVDLELGRDGYQEAAEACARIVAIEGPRSPAVATLQDLVAGDESLQRRGHRALAGGLEEYARSHPDAPDAGLAFARAAECLAGPLADAAGARSLLERAVAARPGDLELALALGRRLEQEGAPMDALERYRGVLAAAPRHAAAWRGMARVFAALSPPRPPSVALACLASVGAASPAELRRCGARARRTLRATPPPVSTWERLVSVSSPEFAALDAFHQAVVDTLGRVHVPRLRELGLDHGDRLGARGAHPLRAAAPRGPPPPGGGHRPPNPPKPTPTPPAPRRRRARRRRARRRQLPPLPHQGRGDGATPRLHQPPEPPAPRRVPDLARGSAALRLRQGDDPDGAPPAGAAGARRGRHPGARRRRRARGTDRRRALLLGRRPGRAAPAPLRAGERPARARRGGARGGDARRGGARRVDPGHPRERDATGARPRRRRRRLAAAPDALSAVAARRQGGRAPPLLRQRSGVRAARAVPRARGARGAAARGAGRPGAGATGRGARGGGSGPAPYAHRYPTARAPGARDAAAVLRRGARGAPAAARVLPARDAAAAAAALLVGAATAAAALLVGAATSATSAAARGRAEHRARGDGGRGAGRRAGARLGTAGTRRRGAVPRSPALGATAPRAPLRTAAAERAQGATTTARPGATIPRRRGAGGAAGERRRRTPAPASVVSPAARRGRAVGLALGARIRLPSGHAGAPRRTRRSDEGERSA